MGSESKFRKGRAAISNTLSRFVNETRETIDDGWERIDEDMDRAASALKTSLSIDNAKHVISYNQSPDVGFDRSINPYRGCEHGCVYCFARPTHAYLNLSPGLDFESRLFYKPDADILLRRELNARCYQPAPIAVGINTDAYQPVEKQTKLTRKILGVLQEHRHPLTIVTKSALIERDLDILSEMAGDNLVKVIVSVTTLDHDLARVMEPRATAPARRLKIIESLSQKNVPAGVLVAPVIPVLNDSELETILTESRKRGAESAGYVLIRLPHEVKHLFREWLAVHFPDKAQHIMNRIQDCRGGKDYSAEFGVRMKGSGVFADLIRKRFQVAGKKLGFGEARDLDCGKFKKTDVKQSDVKQSGQLELF